MLLYDTAGCEGGEGSNEMLLQLGFICRHVTLHDERGKVLSKCSWTYAFV